MGSVAISRLGPWSCFSTGNTKQSFEWFGLSQWVLAPSNKLGSKRVRKKICGDWKTTQPLDLRPQNPHSAPGFRWELEAGSSSVLGRQIHQQEGTKGTKVHGCSRVRDIMISRLIPRLYGAIALVQYLI